MYNNDKRKTFINLCVWVKPSGTKICHLEVLFKCLIKTLIEKGGFNLSGILTYF